MISLQRIRLSQFRNFRELDLEFHEGLNAIIGPNAIGKTTLLEAIHFISIGRSFRTNKLHEVIQKRCSSFAIQAFFTKDSVEQTLSIYYDGTKKEIKHNETSYNGFSPLLGLFPTVVYSPFDIELVHGSPDARRRFLNILIAQSNSLYVYHLMRYVKALNNRNALLRERNLATIEIWEDELIKASKVIQEERARTVKQLSEKAKIFYRDLTTTSEEIELIYKPSAIAFEQSRQKELLQGYTLTGPHRDDLEMTLNNLSLKNYASEGQKRTFIAALKLAETACLRPALLLIDDFGIHLDEQRKAKLEETLSSHPQLFLTSPFPIKETTPLALN